MKDSIHHYGRGGVSFSGPNAVEVFRSLSLASGLKLYASAKILPNRMWTPSAMMKAASQITGKQFKPRDYEGAAKALQKWAEALRATIQETTDVVVICKRCGQDISDGYEGCRDPECPTEP